MKEKKNSIDAVKLDEINLSVINYSSLKFDTD